MVLPVVFRRFSLLAVLVHLTRPSNLTPILTQTSTRLCPLLNGKMPRDADNDELSGLGSIKAPVAASFTG